MLPFSPAPSAAKFIFLTSHRSCPFFLVKSPPSSSRFLNPPPPLHLCSRLNEFLFSYPLSLYAYSGPFLVEDAPACFKSNSNPFSSYLTSRPLFQGLCELPTFFPFYPPFRSFSSRQLPPTLCFIPRVLKYQPSPGDEGRTFEERFYPSRAPDHRGGDVHCVPLFFFFFFFFLYFSLCSPCFPPTPYTLLDNSFLSHSFFFWHNGVPFPSLTFFVIPMVTCPASPFTPLPIFHFLPCPSLTCSLPKKLCTGHSPFCLFSNYRTSYQSCSPGYLATPHRPISPPCPTVF